jgi:hypothetical protein
MVDHVAGHGQTPAQLKTRTRYLAHGTVGTAGPAAPDPFYLSATLAWCHGILAVAIPTCVARYRRR